MSKNTIQNTVAVFVLMGLILLFIQGCDDAVNHNLSNAVYIAEAEVNNSMEVIVDENGGAKSFSVRLADFVDSDVTVDISSDPKSLEEFNKKTGSSYLPLPEEYYSFSKESISIKSGKIGSSAIQVNIKPLDENLSGGDKYAIPVSLTNIQGNVSALESSKNLFVLLEQVVITPVVYLSGGNVIQIQLENPLLNLKEWTYEFRFKKRAFSGNNITCFHAAHTEKPGTKIYSRFGDVVTKPNQYQAKILSAKPTSVTEFAPDTWYHIAVVYNGATIKFYINGEPDVNVPSPAPGTLFNLNVLRFGNSKPNFTFNGQVNELRFWSVARNQKELSDNMCSVNPKSEGLEVYLKLNEGKGGTFTDKTDNGNNGLATKGDATEWIQNVRCPDVN